MFPWLWLIWRCSVSKRNTLESTGLKTPSAPVYCLISPKDPNKPWVSFVLDLCITVSLWENVGCRFPKGFWNVLNLVYWSNGQTCLLKLARCRVRLVFTPRMISSGANLSHRAKDKLEIHLWMMRLTEFVFLVVKVLLEACRGQKSNWFKLIFTFLSVSHEKTTNDYFFMYDLKMFHWKQEHLTVSHMINDINFRL